MNLSIEEKLEKAIKIFGVDKTFTSSHEDFPCLKEAAEKGIIGCYPFFAVAEGRERFFFYTKGMHENDEFPMLVEIDKSKLPMEFGAIKRKIDAEDLSKRGIISQFSQVSAHFDNILTFIKAYVTKSSQDIHARRAIKTLFNRGLIISPPMMVWEVVRFKCEGLIFTPLRVGWADYVCPRCEMSIRLLSQDETTPEHAGVTCPHCQTKFGTKN